MVFKHFRRVAGKVSSAALRFGSRLRNRFRSPKEEHLTVVALKKRPALLERIKSSPYGAQQRSLPRAHRVPITEHIAAPLSALVGSLTEITKKQPGIKLDSLYSKLGELPQKHDMHDPKHRVFGDSKRANLAIYLNTVAISSKRLVEIGLTKDEIRELCEDLLPKLRK